MSEETKKLRAEYAEVFGKAAYHGWDDVEIQKRIDDKRAGNETNDEVYEAEVGAISAEPSPTQAELDAMRAGTFAQYKSR